MKIVLINEEGDSRGIASSVKINLEMKRSDRKPASRSKIVPTAREVEKRLKAGQRIDVVVFLSRDLVETAERLAAAYPKTRMVVYTRFAPQGKVIYLSTRAFPHDTDFMLAVLD